MTATLRSFIVISVVLHLGAVAALYDPLPDAGSASPSLRVSIVRTQFESASDATQADAAPLQKTSTKVEPKPEKNQSRAAAHRKPVQPKISVAARRSATAKESAPSATAAQRTVKHDSPESGNRTAVRAQRLSAIQTAPAGNVLRRLFAAHFNYPMLAQRRGWQGEVRLGLRLEPDGRLTHIHIVKSSGFPILDNSAVKTARKVERAPDAAQWLHGERFDMVLPVQYQLKGS